MPRQIARHTLMLYAEIARDRFLENAKTLEGMGSFPVLAKHLEEQAAKANELVDWISHNIGQIALIEDGNDNGEIAA